MKTEEVIATRTIERTATVHLLRVVDLDKIIADADDGSVTVDALKGAGFFVVEVRPNGRGAKVTRVTVGDEVAGLAWVNGFEACAGLKKRVARKPNGKPRAKKPAVAEKPVAVEKGKK